MLLKGFIDGIGESHLQPDHSKWPTVLYQYQPKMPVEFAAVCAIMQQRFDNDCDS